MNHPDRSIKGRISTPLTEPLYGTSVQHQGIAAPWCFDFTQRSDSKKGVELSIDKKSAEGSTPDPTQANRGDAQVRGNVLLWHPLNDFRMFMHQRLVPFF